MKARLLILGLAFATSPAFGADLQHWADEATRKVYFVTRPRVTVQVDHIGVDKDYWDMVTIGVDYSNPKMTEYFDRLKLAFPGYQYMRLFMNAQGDFKLSVPVLGIDEQVKAMPGVDGPWMNYQGFVTKAKSEEVRRAIAKPDAVSILANVTVTYKGTKALERIELGTEVCKDLDSREGTVFGSLVGSGKVIAQINDHTFRFPETRAALIRSVFDSCLELPADSAVGSFGQLLDVSVELRVRPPRPYGETRAESQTSTVVPLQTDVFVSFGGQS